MGLIRGVSTRKREEKRRKIEEKRRGGKLLALGVDRE
jgi:hypothetical protein